MAKETCKSCDARLTGQASFCARCGTPTQHATQDEVLEWDLKQWRAHIDRSVAAEAWNGGHAGGSSVGPLRSFAATSIARLRTLEEAPPEPATRAPVIVPDLDASVPHVSLWSLPAKLADEDLVVSRGRARKRRRLRLGFPKLRREVDRVINLDSDDPFSYRACPTCSRSDWVVRTFRNEDATRSHWCLRCSRSFKTNARIRRALKPYAAAALIPGSIALLALVLR